MKALGIILSALVFTSCSHVDSGARTPANSLDISSIPESSYHAGSCGAIATTRVRDRLPPQSNGEVIRFADVRHTEPGNARAKVAYRAYFQYNTKTPGDNTTRVTVGYDAYSDECRFLGTISNDSAI